MTVSAPTVSTTIDDVGSIVGMEFGPSGWRAIPQEDIDLYARLSGDDNPIHVDAEAAARSPFGGRIAHGMLTASLVSTVLGTRLPGPGAVYISQSVRFLAPVRIGDTVIARAEVAALGERRRVRMATWCMVGERKVLDGEAVLMVPSRKNGG